MLPIAGLEKVWCRSGKSQVLALYRVRGQPGKDLVLAPGGLVSDVGTPLFQSWIEASLSPRFRSYAARCWRLSTSCTARGSSTET